MIPAYAIDVQPVPNSLGIRAWLVEEHSAPSVSIAFDFAGGSSQDPADRRGLTNLFVGLLYEGAGDLDSSAYKARLKDRSIQLGWDFDRDSLYGIVITPNANRAEAARLMNLAMTAPRYDSEAVERVRELILAGARNRSPNSAGLLAFMAALFPDHIFGVWESGDVPTLTAVTVDDLRAQRQRLFGLSNLKVVAVGDIDKAGLAAVLTEAFAGLPATVPLVPIADASAATGRRVDTVAAVPQTSIRFGGPGVKQSDADLVAAQAAAYILGDRGAGGRLFDRLVTDRKLTTAVSLALNSTAYGGWFAGNATVRPADADAVIALIDQEAKRFAAEGPTTDELTRSQAYLINAHVAHFDSSPAVATELTKELSANLGADYPERYVELVLRLTTADVRRVAERMFGGGLLIFTLGPAATP